MYGSTALKYSVLSGANSISIELPQGVSTNFFLVGDTLRISDKNMTTGLGNEDFVGITAVTVTGSTVAIDFSPSLSAGYNSSTAKASNVLEYGDLYAKTLTPVVTSASGTFDLSKVVLNNRSSISSIWTITFTSSTAYTLTSSVVGAAGSSNLSTPIAPNNTTYALPYLSIPTNAFGGNFLTGDTIMFETTSATIPVWIKRIVPIGATPVAVNKAVYILDGGTV
jgi:hypothetical protein